MVGRVLASHWLFRTDVAEGHGASVRGQKDTRTMEQSSYHQEPVTETSKGGSASPYGSEQKERCVQNSSTRDDACSMSQFSSPSSLDLVQTCRMLISWICWLLSIKYTCSVNNSFHLSTVDENQNRLCETSPDSCSSFVKSTAGSVMFSSVRNKSSHPGDTPTPSGAKPVSNLLTSSHSPRPRASAASFCSVFSLMLCSFSLALCCYIRPDSILFVCAFLVPQLFPEVQRVIPRTTGHFLNVFFCALGIVAGIAVGIADDFYFYDFGVLSPVNWFKFNVLSNTTSELFGTEPGGFYINEFFRWNFGMVFLLVINIGGLIAAAYGRRAEFEIKMSSFLFGENETTYQFCDSTDIVFTSATQGAAVRSQCYSTVLDLHCSEYCVPGIGFDEEMWHLRLQSCSGWNVVAVLRHTMVQLPIS